MTTSTIRLLDDTAERLKSLAKNRGLSTNKLVEEMSARAVAVAVAVAVHGLLYAAIFTAIVLLAMPNIGRKRRNSSSRPAPWPRAARCLCSTWGSRCASSTWRGA